MPQRYTPPNTQTGQPSQLRQALGYVPARLAKGASGSGVTVSGGPSNPVIEFDVQEVLDGISNTQGSVLYRGALEWEALPPGTAGQTLTTNGAAANPTWTTPAAGTPGGSSGQIQYNNAGAFGGFTASGDVTINTGTGVATIGTNVVSNGKFRQSAALSVVGRSANSTGDVADIAAANDKEVLRRSGTAIGFGAIDLASSAAVSGNLSVNNLNSGTGANSGTFWRGDGTWDVPTGGGMSASELAQFRKMTQYFFGAMV